MSEEEEEKKENDDFEQTEIYLNRSKSGKGLTIREKEDSMLTVSIEAVKKVISGEISGTRFSRFKSSGKSEGINA